MFGNGPNDIAVGVPSIFGEAKSLKAAQRHHVACHHLNYFTAAPSRAVIDAIG
jgi:hypothetical protein